MKHNVVRAKAISAIFRLQQFTVQQLAEVSGLKPNQLYPILKDCKDKGFLATESPTTMERKAHRPVLTYSLTSDHVTQQSIAEELLPLVPQLKEGESMYRMTSNLDLRSSLANELQPLISVSAEEARTRAELDSFKETVNKAAALLDEVELQVGFLAENLSVTSDWFSLIDKKIAETQDELETATYESGIQLEDLIKTEVGQNASQEEPWYSLKIAWVRFRKYAKQVDDLKQTSEAAHADLGAQKEYAAAMSGLNLTKVSAEAIEHDLTELYKKADNPSLREIFSTTLENLRETLADRHHVSASSTIIHSLMASAIRYCSDAHLPLKMGAYLLKQKNDDRCLIYNIANLRILAGGESESEEAFTLWNQWAEDFLSSGHLWKSSEKAGRYRAPYSYVALISIPLVGIDASVFSELEVKLGEQATFSVVSHSPLTTRGLRPYVAEPTLCDPSSCVQEIRISESLGNQIGRLYVYGSLEKQVKNVPGMPAVRLATGLVMSGVERVKAWEIAHSLNAEHALLVLHSFDKRPAASTHVDDAVRELQERSGGLLLDSMQTKQGHGAPVVALAR